MTFPLLIQVGPWAVSAHSVLEVAAYAIGFRLYLRQRRVLSDELDSLTRWRLLAAAALGALLGARLLAYAADPQALAGFPWWLRPWMGKTIVGGLLGGTLAVELLKRRLGLQQRTGDVYALPLAVGIAVGRLGCFLQGVSDHTAGTPSSLPWALDQGDGIPRHPAALYEAAACLLIAGLLWRLQRTRYQRGDLYRAFLLSYCAVRFALELVKPYPTLAGLTLYQWACLGLLLAWRRDAWRLLDPRGSAHA